VGVRWRGPAFSCDLPYLVHVCIQIGMRRTNQEGGAQQWRSDISASCKVVPPGCVQLPSAGVGLVVSVSEEDGLRPYFSIR